MSVRLGAATARAERVGDAIAPDGFADHLAAALQCWPRHLVEALILRPGGQNRQVP